LRWAYYNHLGDSRAGQLQFNKRGDAVYTGAIGMAKEAINYMAEAEAVNLGDNSISPSESLFSY
jgi:hypothetical protein